MAVQRITKRTVDALLEAEAGKVIRDDKLTGFRARLNANGTITYSFEYRSARGRGGQTRRVTIGREREGGGMLTPDQARAIAEKLAAEVVAGGDPAADRTRSRETPTFIDFADRHLAAAEAIAIAQPLTARLRLGTVRNMQSVIRKHVGPAFGRKRLDAIAKADVVKLFATMSAKTPVGANGMLETVRHIYKAAAEAGEIADGTDPARGIRMNKKNKRERFLTIAEVERLGAALREAETTGLPWTPTAAADRLRFLPGGEQVTRLEPDSIAAIRLLIFTGCRKREILGARWDAVDLERGVLFVHGKTGRRAVLLPAPAAVILSEIPRRGDFVFPGRAGSDEKQVPRSDISRAWHSIIDRAQLPGLRLHDLRHSFASFAAAGGASLHIIGKLLGHSTPAMTARYAHLADDPVRAVADRTAGLVSAALDGTGGSVVPMKRAAS